MAENAVRGPMEGQDKCWCGSKYWDLTKLEIVRDRELTLIDAIVCHSCGEKFDPRNLQEGSPSLIGGSAC